MGLSGKRSAAAGVKGRSPLQDVLAKRKHGLLITILFK